MSIKLLKNNLIKTRKSLRPNLMINYKNKPEMPKKNFNAVIKKMVVTQNAKL